MVARAAGGIRRTRSTNGRDITVRFHDFVVKSQQPALDNQFGARWKRVHDLNVVLY
jgi:hypothetical protein